MACGSRRHAHVSINLDAAVLMNTEAVRPKLMPSSRAAYGDSSPETWLTSSVKIVCAFVNRPAATTAIVASINAYSTIVWPREPAANR
jgi:hypothetical protein